MMLESTVVYVKGQNVMQKDLEGLTVVSIEQAVAAPYATSRLANAGARVLKVERPVTGDFARHYDRLVEGHSAYFVWLNGGKESICLDLKDSNDAELLKKMISSADIMIQNLKPGTLEKLGLGSAYFRKMDPRLITCDISGFGETGPRSHLKAYDLIVQAETGLCSITGTTDGPARVGVSVCDIAAGMTAHAAILQALVGRARTGQGRSIKVSLFDSLADWMNVPILQYLYGGKTVQRSGVAHPSIAPYGAFTCQGGERVIFSIQNDREWTSLCAKFLENTELATDTRFKDNTARVENRLILDAIISEKFSELTVDHASQQLETIGIAYGRMHEIHEAAHHPHLRFIKVDTPDGEVRIIAPGAIIGDTEERAGSIPELGAHTQKIRAEFSAEFNMEPAL